MPHTCHASHSATLPCIRTFRRQATSEARTRGRKSKPRQPSPSPQRYRARLNARGPLLTDGTQRIFSGAPHSVLPQENFCYKVPRQCGDVDMLGRSGVRTPDAELRSLASLAHQKILYGGLEPRGVVWERRYEAPKAVGIRGRRLVNVALIPTRGPLKPGERAANYPCLRPLFTQAYGRCGLFGHWTVVLRGFLAHPSPQRLDSSRKESGRRSCSKA
jgi:hypothetical protein